MLVSFLYYSLLFPKLTTLYCSLCRSVKWVTHWLYHSANDLVVPKGFFGSWLQTQWQLWPHMAVIEKIVQTHNKGSLWHTTLFEMKGARLLLDFAKQPIRALLAPVKHCCFFRRFCSCCDMNTVGWKKFIAVKVVKQHTGILKSYPL